MRAIRPQPDAPVPGTALVLVMDTFTAKAAIVRDLRLQHRKLQALVVEVQEELRKAEDELARFVGDATRI